MSIRQCEQVNEGWTKSMLKAIYVCPIDKMWTVMKAGSYPMWYVPTIPNVNNIKFVFFCGRQPGYSGLNAHMSTHPHASSMINKGNLYRNQDAVKCLKMLMNRPLVEGLGWDVPLIGCKEIDGVVYEDLYITAYLNMNTGRYGFVDIERMSREHARMVRHSRHIMLECDSPAGYLNDCIYVVEFRRHREQVHHRRLGDVDETPNELYGNDTSPPSRPRTLTHRPCRT